MNRRQVIGLFAGLLGLGTKVDSAKAEEKHLQNKDSYRQDKEWLYCMRLSFGPHMKTEVFFDDLSKVDSSRDYLVSSCRVRDKGRTGWLFCFDENRDADTKPKFTSLMTE